MESEAEGEMLPPGGPRPPSTSSPSVLFETKPRAEAAQNLDSQKSGLPSFLPVPGGFPHLLPTSAHTQRSGPCHKHQPVCCTERTLYSRPGASAEAQLLDPDQLCGPGVTRPRWLCTHRSPVILLTSGSRRVSHPCLLRSLFFGFEDNRALSIVWFANIPVMFPVHPVFRNFIYLNQSKARYGNVSHERSLLVF